MNPETWGRGDRRRLATRDVPPGVQALVDEKQGGRFCVLCREQGLVTPDDEPLVLDHLQPLSRGGDNHHSNLRWLCAGHNARRGTSASFAGAPVWHVRRQGRDEVRHG
jgi:5-methylcytosine-specific restriction endonuclease McrA